MGMGDVKLSAGIGLIAGFYGLQTLFLSTFLSFTFGALFGVMLILFRKGNLKTTIPFGPFLVIGQVVAMLVAR
jgi:leader peptidase (prepilin peptidase)/N-methyltransferase